LASERAERRLAAVLAADYWIKPEFRVDEKARPFPPLVSHED
jgi:hypothetical protein